MNTYHYRWYQKAQRNARKVVLHPFTGIVLYCFFLRFYMPSTLGGEDIVKGMARSFALVLSLGISTCVTLVLGHVRKLWEDLEWYVLLSFASFAMVFIVLFIPITINEYMSGLALLCWVGFLLWIYFFFRCKEGVKCTYIRFSKFRFTNSFRRGLRGHIKRMFLYHELGVLRMLQFGIVTILFTISYEFLIRIWLI